MLLQPSLVNTFTMIFLNGFNILCIIYFYMLSCLTIWGELISSLQHCKDVLIRKLSKWMIVTWLLCIWLFPVALISNNVECITYKQKKSILKRLEMPLWNPSFLLVSLQGHHSRHESLIIFMSSDGQIRLQIGHHLA